ncbi:MAG: trypsin-like peptidase domain-containing protein, partial [candidate division WOR-3 bacterium]
MKEYRWILLVSILFLFCFPFIYSLLTQDGLNPIIKNVQPSVVSILTYDIEGKNIGQGIGFFISQNGDIITAYHVLLGASSAEIKTIDGKRYPIVTIVAEDVESDLIRASVDIPQKFVHTLKIGDSIPDVGEKVIVIGNTLELERTVSDGIISTVRETPKFGKIIQITAPISSNSSGSPVLNINGEIIGVATFQLTEGQNCNFAIPIEKVAKLLPSKVETFSQWGEGRTRNWISSAEGLYYTGIYFISDWPNLADYLPGIFKTGFRLDPTRSTISSVKGFPRNVEIEADLMFAALAPLTNVPDRIFAVLPDEKTLPIALHYSVLALPEEPMKPRLADDRVG